tara:strand:+ start:42 stop:365 length:324 start_codon:yes stop_codon:yes gene_type:complete
MYKVSNEVLGVAVESVPEAVLEMPEVQGALKYLADVIEQYENVWVDPDSEYYAETMRQAKRDGAVAVVEKYQDMLAEALHRKKMFGEDFDLESYMDELSKIPIEEVL